ncbi:MAG: hypothetical protein M1816_006893 [Peltula sp. TS41687]|nr:MAG: hypothetical protein M1816_006893 [Peltula sp. TS41687]
MSPHLSQSPNQLAPLEPDKSFKFTDADGRTFYFAFNDCQTWARMEKLIRQVFRHHVDEPYVAERRYHLIGPSGDIILPQDWEALIKPDWEVTMWLWDRTSMLTAVPEELEEEATLEEKDDPQTSGISSEELGQPETSNTAKVVKMTKKQKRQRWRTFCAGKACRPVKSHQRKKTLRDDTDVLV